MILMLISQLDGLSLTGAEIFAFSLENHTNFEEKIKFLPAEINIIRHMKRVKTEFLSSKLV